jgi:hypothetical protein
MHSPYCLLIDSLLDCSSFISSQLVNICRYRAKSPCRYLVAMSSGVYALSSRCRQVICL